MSRTYRRKNTNWKKRLYVDSWYFSSIYTSCYWEEVSRKSPKRLEIQYEGDFYYRFNPPSSFRRGLNKNLRSKNKAILARFIREDREYPFIPYLKNAKYLYY